jgi:hypothetical protein
LSSIRVATQAVIQGFAARLGPSRAKVVAKVARSPTLPLAGSGPTSMRSAPSATGARSSASVKWTGLMPITAGICFANPNCLANQFVNITPPTMSKR